MADGGVDALPTSPPERVIEAGGASCANGVRDGDETDIDCGGESCPSCPNGSACAANRDCASLSCPAKTCTSTVGCSDGTREAFASEAMFPNIAACSGGWSMPGLGSTTAPACARRAGNDSSNPTGAGCNVADLCQPGWHVCTTPAEITERVGAATCAGATVEGQAAFFAIRQSGPGDANCGAGANDLFGCGSLGAAPKASCAPLDRFSNDLCASLGPPWTCGADPYREFENVTKPGSEGGGVLCCRD